MIAHWAMAPLHHPLNRYAVTGGALRHFLVEATSPVTWDGKPRFCLPEKWQIRHNRRGTNARALSPSWPGKRARPGEGSTSVKLLCVFVGNPDQSDRNRPDRSCCHSLLPFVLFGGISGSDKPVVFILGDFSRQGQRTFSGRLSWFADRCHCFLKGRAEHPDRGGRGVRKNRHPETQANPVIFSGLDFENLLQSVQRLSGSPLSRIHQDKNIFSARKPSHHVRLPAESFENLDERTFSGRRSESQRDKCEGLSRPVRCHQVLKNLPDSPLGIKTAIGIFFQKRCECEVDPDLVKRFRKNARFRSLAAHEGFTAHVFEDGKTGPAIK